MQDSKRSELMEAIRRAVALFREAGRRFLNKDMVDAVIADQWLALRRTGQPVGAGEAV